MDTLNQLAAMFNGGASGVSGPGASGDGGLAPLGGERQGGPIVLDASSGQPGRTGDGAESTSYRRTSAYDSSLPGVASLPEPHALFGVVGAHFGTGADLPPYGGPSNDGSLVGLDDGIRRTSSVAPSSPWSRNVNNC